MDFAERIEDVAKRLKNFEGTKPNEEATKSGLIMPFIAALGYDVFNPQEVAPEYSAPLGQQKDARVDYAIMSEGKPIILIEAKALGEKLEAGQCNQLLLYFHGTEARIAILTDGNIYKFYSDLEAPNKMDIKPFMELNLSKLDNSLLFELRKLAKGKFDCDKIINSAQELKYKKEFRQILADQFVAVDDEFLGFFVGKVYDGKKTQATLNRFRTVLQTALSQFLKSEVDKLLQDALNANKEPEEKIVPQEPAEPAATSKIITTPLEKEAYYLVKSLLIGVVDPERVVLKDAVSFCNILFDGSIQKPIFRLYFNNEAKLRVATFDKDKNEERHDITSLNDILPLADKIRERAKAY